MEDKINICSYDACELINGFLNNEETHNKEFFEKDLIILNKKLRKQKTLLNSLNRISKEYSYLEDMLIQTRRNILEYIYDLKSHIKETNKRLKTI